VLKKRLWRGVMGLLTILALLSLLLPQVRIVVWEGEQQRLLYLWGGHGALGSDVSGVAYILAALMGIIAALLMIGGFRDLQKETPAPSLASTGLRYSSQLSWYFFWGLRRRYLRTYGCSTCMPIAMRAGEAA
jgi:hypothetical protein